MGKKDVLLVLIGLFYSSMIALVSYGFIMVEKLGSHFLWESLPHHLHIGKLYSFLILAFLWDLLSG